MFTGYSGWIDGLRSWLDVDAPEYSDTRLGNFIRIGEETLGRKIRNRHTENYASATIGATDEGRVTLPTDFLEARGVTNDATGDPIEPASPDVYFKRKAKGGVDSIYPEMYMVIGNEAHFMPYGNGQPISLIYYKEIPRLASGSMESNVFTEKYPDALLYSACMAAAPYMIDDVRVPIWQNEFARILRDIEETKNKESYGNAPIRRRLNAY